MRDRPRNVLKVTTNDRDIRWQLQRFVTITTRIKVKLSTEHCTTFRPSADLPNPLFFRASHSTRSSLRSSRPSPFARQMQDKRRARAEAVLRPRTKVSVPCNMWFFVPAQPPERQRFEKAAPLARHVVGEAFRRSNACPAFRTESGCRKLIAPTTERLTDYVTSCHKLLHRERVAVHFDDCTAPARQPHLLTSFSFCFRTGKKIAGGHGKFHVLFSALHCRGRSSWQGGFLCVSFEPSNER